MTQDNRNGSDPMLDSHSPYHFRIRIDTHDHGNKVFEELGQFDCQTEMSRAVAWAMARGLDACFNVPPSSAELLYATESHKHGNGLLAAIGYAVGECWTGCCNLEEAVSIRIDIDKLMEEESADKKDMSAKVLRRKGVEVVRAK